MASLRCFCAAALAQFVFAGNEVSFEGLAGRSPCVRTISGHSLTCIPQAHMNELSLINTSAITAKLDAAATLTYVGSDAVWLGQFSFGKRVS